jgi:hypothetical protein
MVPLLKFYFHEDVRRAAVQVGGLGGWGAAPRSWGGSGGGRQTVLAADGGAGVVEAGRTRQRASSSPRLAPLRRAQPCRPAVGAAAAALRGPRRGRGHAGRQQGVCGAAVCVHVGAAGGGAQEGARQRHPGDVRGAAPGGGSWGGGGWTRICFRSLGPPPQRCRRACSGQLRHVAPPPAPGLKTPPSPPPPPTPSMLESISEVVDLVDPALLGQAQVESAFDGLRHVLKQAERRREARAKRLEQVRPPGPLRPAQARCGPPPGSLRPRPAAALGPLEQPFDPRPTPPSHPPHTHPRRTLTRRRRRRCGKRTRWRRSWWTRWGGLGEAAFWAELGWGPSCPEPRSLHHRSSTHAPTHPRTLPPPKVTTCIGSFLKRFGDAVLPYVESLMPHIAPMLDKASPRRGMGGARRGGLPCGSSPAQGEPAV